MTTSCIRRAQLPAESRPWEPAHSPDEPRVTRGGVDQGRYGKGENGSTTPAAARCGSGRSLAQRTGILQPDRFTSVGGFRFLPMRSLTVTAIAAALVVVPAHSASATTTPVPSPQLHAATAQMSVGAAMPQSLSTMRTAAFTLANQFATQAPRLSTTQKARNANYLADKMRLPNISLVQRAVAIGKTQLGTQYVYGGTTPAGFDCSGFTSFAFAKAGKRLPRTAAQQQRAAKRVSTPRPGDLVFIGARAHHVGIYVGNGKMLHSPRTGKPVQIAKIYAKATYGRV